MRSALIFSLALSLLVITESAYTPRNCACTFELNYVCGANGRTYSNPCEALCFNVEIRRYGRCEETYSTTTYKPNSCICTLEINYVCGADGKTYSNPCQARCFNVEIRRYGRCGEAYGTTTYKPNNCVCTLELNYVCGADGKTYSNPCQARCFNVEIRRYGRCEEAYNTTTVTYKPKECVCSREYNLVCGTDGLNYSNPCMAGCANVGIRYYGGCRAATPTPLRSTITSTTAASKSMPCICTMDINLVCGADGKTYSNPCLAMCSHVGVRYNGSCRSTLSPHGGQRTTSTAARSCTCSKDLALVCGSDGRTYANSCLAACNNSTVASAGPCRK